MRFTALTTNVLLEIYEYLDLIDAINLSETCVRLRDVAQLHFKRYKTFNLDNFIRDPDQAKRRNGIDTSTVLKRIGAFVSLLVADLDENRIGTDLAKAIRKYCVNVKSLYLFAGFDSSMYTEWFNNLKLERISFLIEDLLPMYLAETTTLEELVIYSNQFKKGDEVCSALEKLLERNCNLIALRMGIFKNFDYEIFANLNGLKRLDLHIKDEDLEVIATNLKMTDLEQLRIEFRNYHKQKERNDKFNIFLKEVSESAPNLKDLSIKIDTEYSVEYLPLALDLFDLTSLRLDICSSYKWLSTMQPNLKHLDLVIYGVDRSDNSMDSREAFSNRTQQIFFLIKNLKKLEVFHVQGSEGANILELLNDLRNDFVIRQMLEACGIGRPTLRLYVSHVTDDYENPFLQVTFNFNKSNYRVTDIPHKINYFSPSQEHQSLLPCCY